MEIRICGRSEIKVSALGIGCWSFGGGDYWGKQNQKDVNTVVHKALDLGINYFDTAEMYNDGRSEESLGEALRERRDEAIIGTKVSPTNIKPKILLKHLNASLRRLRTDYIDIYMIHWPINNHLQVEEAFETLIDLQSEGIIRSIGVSNFGVEQLSEAISTGARIDINQMCYNLLSRSIEIEILPFCHKHDISVLAYMPLMQGILTGKYGNPDEVPPKRARTRHFSGDRPGSRHGESGAEEETFKAVNSIREIALHEGIPMSQLSIAWVLAKPGIASVLMGTRNLSQLNENIKSESLTLSLKIIKQLDSVTKPILKKLGSNIDLWQGGENSRIK
jgi:aryl-alcohol dehydrogenase-like predicted oxidoreductase